MPGDTIDNFCRRKARTARNIAGKLGFWSKVWCQRVIDWDCHLRRGCAYNHICFKLLSHHGRDWLWQRRSEWVPTNGQVDGRCTLFAGRIGTRLNVGRPQPRWEDGVHLAKEVTGGRTVAIKGCSFLSISTISADVHLQLAL